MPPNFFFEFKNRILFKLHFASCETLLPWSLRRLSLKPADDELKVVVGCLRFAVLSSFKSDDALVVTQDGLRWLLAMEFPPGLQKLVAILVKKLQTHKLRIHWVVPKHGALDCSALGLYAQLLQRRISFVLAANAWRKHEIILYVLLSVQHPNNVVIVAELLLWWELYVLRQLDRLEWHCKSVVQHRSFLCVYTVSDWRHHWDVFQICNSSPEQLLDVLHQFSLCTVDFAQLALANFNFLAHSIKHRLCLDIFELL
jgi:hypothetical protein